MSQPSCRQGEQQGCGRAGNQKRDEPPPAPQYDDTGEKPHERLDSLEEIREVESLPPREYAGVNRQRKGCPSAGEGDQEQRLAQSDFILRELKELGERVY